MSSEPAEPQPTAAIGKQTPQHESHEVAESQPQPTEPRATSTENDTPATDPEPPMSKNAMKRLKRRREWDEGKDERRKRRKEKRVDYKVRKREQRAALIAGGADPATVYAKKKQPSTLVPVSLVLDCDFEQYMFEKEHISLASQVTRCYADNRAARYRTHLWVAGWKGKIRERFTTVLAEQHKNWKGIGYDEGSFVDCVEKARERMKTNGGEVIAPLQRSLDEPSAWMRDERDALPTVDPEPAPSEALKDIVYLTSDSPYTLERLEPNTHYIIGGLVDKNREKGLCYRRAREAGVRTAKLPIGRFMKMASRQVLATNHVVEIMLKWLECENWGEAFLSVIPKRKGGVLRDEGAGSEAGNEAEGAEDEEAESTGDEDAGVVEGGDEAVVEGNEAMAEATPEKS